MPQGIQVFKADGSPLLDTSHRTFRVLTVAAIGTIDGNYSDSRLGSGAKLVGVATQQDLKKTPNINVVGDTVSWNWGGIGAGDRATDTSIMIAVY
jgi:hypothetical protein